MTSIYDSYGFLFAKANEKLQKLLLPDLAEKGLSFKNMGLLLIIDERPGLTQREAGEVQMIDRTTMTQQIDYLDKCGLVRREQNPEDRRAYGLFLTKAGEDMVRFLWGKISAAQNTLFSKLSAQQQDELKKYLLTIVK